MVANGQADMVAALHSEHTMKHFGHKAVINNDPPLSCLRRLLYNHFLIIMGIFAILLHTKNILNIKQSICLFSVI